MVLEGLVALLAYPELTDHRQVDEAECHQRTEVDQRQRGIQIKRHGGESQRANHQHVDGRSAVFRVDVAKYPLRDHVVTTHHVEDARHTGVSRHAGGQYRDRGADQHYRLEEGAADVEGDLRQYRIRMLEAGEAREVELQAVGDHHEDDAADKGSQHDGARDHLAGVRGLFGERAQPVKAQEREAENGCTGEERHHAG